MRGDVRGGDRATGELASGDRPVLQFSFTDAVGGQLERCVRSPAEREKDRDVAITFEYVNDFCSQMRIGVSSVPVDGQADPDKRWIVVHHPWLRGARGTYRGGADNKFPDGSPSDRSDQAVRLMRAPKYRSNQDTLKAQTETVSPTSSANFHSSQETPVPPQNRCSVARLPASGSRLNA